MGSTGCAAKSGWINEQNVRLFALKQRFPNCDTRTTSGTRSPSRWYANRPTTFCLSSQNTFIALFFTSSGSVN